MDVQRQFNAVVLVVGTVLAPNKTRKFPNLTHLLCSDWSILSVLKASTNDHTASLCCSSMIGWSLNNDQSEVSVRLELF